jgi:hypothetical protein
MRGNPYRAVFVNVGGSQLVGIAQLVSRDGFGTLRLEQPIILIGRPDPKPLGLIALDRGQGAKVATETSGPKPPDFFEMKRRMLRVAQPEFEVLAREPANRRRKLAQAPTKVWGRRGVHRAPPSAVRPPLPSTTNTGDSACRSGVVFDLAIPLCGVAFVQLVQKLAKLRRRKFRDGCFDFGQRAHVGKAALAGPHLQEAGPLKIRKSDRALHFSHPESLNPRRN